MLKITLIKSVIGNKPVNRRTVAALGLRKIRRTVYKEDNASIRGMIHNVAHLRDHPNFHYVIETMMNKPLLAELVDQADLIYHMAAAVGVKLIVKSPVRTIETNIRGTEIILELAAKKHKRVIIASTSEVYGKSTKIPFCEDDDLVMGSTAKGRWAYA